MKVKPWLLSHQSRVDAVVDCLGCNGFAALFQWLLARHRKRMDNPDRAVLCHGDLFPTNILALPSVSNNQHVETARRPKWAQQIGGTHNTRTPKHVMPGVAGMKLWRL